MARPGLSPETDLEAEILKALGKAPGCLRREKRVKDAGPIATAWAAAERVSTLVVLGADALDRAALHELVGLLPLGCRIHLGHINEPGKTHLASSV